MAPLAPGARQLPLRHISIRVPWHDTDWTGRVCRAPNENTSCLVLPRIRDARARGCGTEEMQLAGQSWRDLDPASLPPCVSERCSFMASYELVRLMKHPYADISPIHGHLLPTPYRLPPYSAQCVPFRWMIRDRAVELAAELQLGFEQELEDEVDSQMGFQTGWVQRKHNQLVMLDTFFSAIQPNSSLCFFYAKRTPLAEDMRRVIIGVGRVTGIGAAVEYRYSETGVHDSVIWERPVQHSIRPDGRDGFLMPYHEVLEYLQEHPEEDPTRFIAFVPDDQFSAFSYCSEHVTNDGAIASLLACSKALREIRTVIPGPWDSCLAWIDDRLNELWRMRGPCPGLGSALTAFGVTNGTLVAFELERELARQGPNANLDPWPLVDRLFRGADGLPGLEVRISKSLRQKWANLREERRALLKLVSRFELTADQATRYYVHEDETRASLRIETTDAEILGNPYLLFELDTEAPDPIGVRTIDRGLFLDDSVRMRYPLPEPSRVDDATDPRRVRAFVADRLLAAGAEGDTLRPRSRVIQEIRALEIEPPCPVDSDLLAIQEPSFAPVVRVVQLANGDPAYQLERAHQFSFLIRDAVIKRRRGIRHTASIPWRQRLDNEFDRGNAAQAPLDAQEEAARREKAAALEELYAARISVLIGPAGTGKTTLLKVLCSERTVKEGGVLLLAPTGKARVRLEGQTGLTGAMTIAQFLLRHDRYNPQSGSYHLSDRPKADDYKTVIIDEASMLTESQLAAVLDALRGVERLILVGDPRQLPPIGAGRPFLDIVRLLSPENVEAIFPRVGPCYAELTVRRRQRGEDRADLLLAEWFSGRPLDPGADEIWDLIREGDVSPHLRFVRWDTPADLHVKLLDILVEELGLSGRDDEQGFELSLGGSLYEGRVFFWAGRDGEPGACAKIEDWQILSPVRNPLHGVEAINRLVQQSFRRETRSLAEQRWSKIPKPMGPEGILYGDKVIHTRNQWRTDVWPQASETGPALRYVANGEIGVVVGQYKTQRLKQRPWKLEVEFASQPGFRYSYYPGELGDEDSPVLELAYALTVHKAQGSEFKRTFVILPSACRLLSRELLYTALTRQEKRIIIFHQGDLHELKRYASEYHSEAARRLTNLFADPNPVQLEDRFLEDGLIHRTRRGDSVRSKSEVIIADLLFSKGIDYRYEAPLRGADGTTRYPDFTVEDSETGLTVYWEHLGLLYDPGYRHRWETKLAWYRGQGILPFSEGGGPRGTLVTTCDTEQGGIDSKEIERIVHEVFGV